VLEAACWAGVRRKFVDLHELHQSPMAAQALERIGALSAIEQEIRGRPAHEVLLFGHGGELVEVFRDRALGLPPLTETLARRMIEKTRIAKALADPVRVADAQADAAVLSR
jgi:hypothetical protein